MVKKIFRASLFLACLAWLVPSAAMADTLIAYFNNFDVPATVAPGVIGTWSGITTTEGVQGYAGLGPAGNQFGGDLLRNTTAYPPLSTTLTLTGLPAHTSVNVNFLLAIIDSWDGIGSAYGPDSFTVKVGGVPVFSKVFTNVDGTSDYTPSSGVLLSSGTYLGFHSGWVDSAYNMYLESAFQDISHTGSSLTIEWFASGPVWQGGNDESWGIDNLQVVLNSDNPVPLPPTVWLLGSGLLGLVGWRGFRKS